MNLGTLVDGYSVIRRHSGDVIDDMGKSLKIALFMQKATPVVAEWEKTRNALIKKYGNKETTEDEQERYVVPPDKFAEFSKELNDINEMDSGLEPSFDWTDFEGFKNGTVAESQALLGLIKNLE